MSAFLEIRNLTAAYGKITALAETSLLIPRGGIVTVVGPNGAGKTTLLNAVAGLIPARGEVLFDGESIASLPTEIRLARGLCLVPEQRELFTTMSVEDNLLLGGYVQYCKGKPYKDALEGVFARFPRLKERRSQYAGTLSGGERQMLAIGRALMSKPALLMLDEPSLGLSPIITRDVLAVVAELRDAGVSILLVEQNVRSALRVSDYAYVLEAGAVTLHGPAAEIANNPRVIDSYLGPSPSQR